MEGPKQHSSESKSWFYASDGHIREATLHEVLGCKPYMLFYERVGGLRLFNKIFHYMLYTFFFTPEPEHSSTLPNSQLNYSTSTS